MTAPDVLRDLQPLSSSWHPFPGARRTIQSSGGASGGGRERMGIWRYDGSAVRTTGARQERTFQPVGVDMGELRGTHVPVLLERCLELLAPALGRGGRTVHVDATLGLAGHAEAVLDGASGDGPDRARPGHRGARSRAGPAGPVRRPGAPGARRLRRAARGAGPAGLSGASTAVLFDLGVSSLQLDAPDRGFAYAQDAPLDMRMDQTRGVTAEEVVNTLRPSGSGPGAAGLRRGEVRRPDRLGDHPGAGARSDHLVGAAGGAGPGRRFRRQPDERADTRQRERFRLYGSR